MFLIGNKNISQKINTQLALPFNISTLLAFVFFGNQNRSKFTKTVSPSIATVQPRSRKINNNAPKEENRDQSKVTHRERSL